MILYSQRDPAFSNTYLPKSRMTINQAGCYLACIATLGQAPDLVQLMNTKGAFANGGLLFSEVLANALGMRYRGITGNQPAGWSVGVTHHFAGVGVPTHFVLVNGNQMIDPLATPAVIEPLKYKIAEYRVFDGIKLPEAIRQELEKKERALTRATGDRKIALTAEVRKYRRLVAAE